MTAEELVNFDKIRSITMEATFKNISLKAALFAIGIRVQALMVQNIGVIPTKQNV